MLGVEEKRSWQFLSRDKLQEALDLLHPLPTRPKAPRKPKPKKRLPWLDQGLLLGAASAVLTRAAHFVVLP